MPKSREPSTTNDFPQKANFYTSSLMVAPKRNKG